VMSQFSLRHSWLKPPGTSELDVTVGKMHIHVDQKNVTEYTSESMGRDDHLRIPAYPLAEWIAENWWPLLWEPRKSEETGDDPDFLTRHSTLFAQGGFPLPGLIFVSLGTNLLISSRARQVTSADVHFREFAQTIIARKEVEAELRHFVTRVVSRLSEHNIENTLLQEFWASIDATKEDEEQFCRLVGALGVSPYACSDTLSAQIDAIAEALGEQLTLDLCLAATPENLVTASDLAKFVQNEAQRSTPVDLTPMTNISPPPDNAALPAWRRGVQAAKRVREKLGIQDTDPRGGDKFLDLIKLETSHPALLNISTVEPIVVGMMIRQDNSANIGLLQPAIHHRRFTGARAAYSAWSSESASIERLLTQAVTRDQQASRAFAAEMMAPLAYIRKNARGSKITQERIQEVAVDLNIGPDVVGKQAANNGMQIVPY
jgi:hypothetical protein